MLEAGEGEVVRGSCGPTEGMGAGRGSRRSRLLLSASANLIPKRQLMGSASKIVSFTPSVLVPKGTYFCNYGTLYRNVLLGVE